MAVRIDYFCTLNEKWPIPGALSASEELRRKTSMAQRFGILVLLYLDLNLRKNEKNISSSFLLIWLYLRKT